MRNPVKDCAAMHRAMRPYATAGMRLANVRLKQGKPTVVLRSARRYEGERFEYAVPVRPEEVERNPRRVMRMLCEEARRDLENHHHVRRAS